MIRRIGSVGVSGTLKDIFKTGSRPSQSDFGDLLDSFFVGNEGQLVLGATGQINPTHTFFTIASTGGEVELSSNPQVLSGTPDQLLVLMGVSDSNYVTLINGNGLILKSTKIPLRRNVVLVLGYINNSWVEVCRNTIITGNYNFRLMSTSKTAEPNDYMICTNPLSGNILLLLPSAPSVGDTVTILDAHGTFFSYPVTGMSETKPVNGKQSKKIALKIPFAEYVFRYVDDVVGWRVLVTSGYMEEMI